MSTFRRLVISVVAALSAVGLVLIPAATASASTVFVPYGVARSVTCPSGSGSCTEWRYGFDLEGATGQFGIYYTGQWSSSGGSYKIVKVCWINNSNQTIYWGDFAVYDLHDNTEYYLGWSTAGGTGYWVGAGKSYCFGESSFNVQGHYIAHNYNSYSNSDPLYSGREYHVLNYHSITGAFTLG